MLMCLEVPSSAISYQMTDQGTDSVFSGDEKSPARRKKTHLSLNDLKKWRNTSSSSSTPSSTPLSTTITPTQILFPRHVTEEQEAYARGFSQALEDLYKKQGYPSWEQQLQLQQTLQQQQPLQQQTMQQQPLQQQIIKQQPQQPLQQIQQQQKLNLTSLNNFSSELKAQMAAYTTFSNNNSVTSNTTILNNSTTATTFTSFAATTTATTIRCDVKPSLEASTTTTNNNLPIACNQASTFLKNNTPQSVYTLQQKQLQQLATVSTQPPFILDNFQCFAPTNSLTPYMNRGFNNTSNNLINNTNYNRPVFTPLGNVSSLYSSPLSQFSMSSNNSNNAQQQKQQMRPQLQPFSPQGQSFSPQNQSFLQQNSPFQQIRPSTSHHLNSPPQLPPYKPHSLPPHPEYDSFSPNFSLKDSSKESPNFSSLNLEEQEKLRLERKRAKNRVAAQKCQTRKVERIHYLESRVSDLRERNKEYKNKTEELRKAVDALKNSINLHVSKGCRILSHSAYNHNDLLPFGS